MTVTDDPRAPFGDWYFARDFSGVRLEALPDQAEAALARLASAAASPLDDPQAVGRARSEAAAVADFRATTPRTLAEVRRVVAARATATVAPEDIRRRAAAIRGRLAQRQLSSATRAYYLGADAFRGDASDLDLLDAVTPAEVEAVQRRVFSRPPAAAIVE